MNNVSPTIMQLDLVGGMGMFSNNPVADAERHHDALADNFAAEVTYHGIEFYVEVNRHSRNVSEITQIDTGDCWYYDLSESALRNIANLAIAKAEL